MGNLPDFCNSVAEFLIDKMRDTKTNGEFFEAMKR